MKALLSSDEDGFRKVLEIVVQEALEAEMTQAIQGTYQGQSVTHFVDPQTGLNVIRDSSGNLLSGWKLSPKQLEYVLTTGKLGGEL
ncbi:hypothetical protein NKJ35_10770 [Mesorhizobium sp. M0136]|uniref:colicin D domain-containing protein n=1 Tax=Mesorhizobium sp. M0136 TaxID=2956890 RepID=UPI003334CB49